MTLLALPLLAAAAAAQPLHSACVAPKTHQIAFLCDLQGLMAKYPGFDPLCCFGEGVPRAEELVVFNPPVNADRRIYYVVGTLKQLADGAYIARIQAGPNVAYFVFRDAVETKRGRAALDSLHFNEGFSLVGRLVGISSLPLAGGGSQPAAVFEALHIEQCTPGAEVERALFWCVYR